MTYIYEYVDVNEDSVDDVDSEEAFEVGYEEPLSSAETNVSSSAGPSEPLTGSAPPAPPLPIVQDGADEIKIKPFPKFQTMKPKKKPGRMGPLLRQEIMARNKFSSTSTLFVNTTISNPNADEIMRCMASALLSHIEKGYKATKKVYYQIFSEVHYPLTKDHLDLVSLPSVRTVHKFISTIFNVMKLDLECMIMCLAYVERVLELGGLTLDQTNWRRLVLSCLIIAAKVWEDLSVYNIDFISFFNNITVADLNRMELVLLSLVQFQVGIPASLYAKYYFDLRTLSTLEEERFPLKPLDKEGARRLEKRSQSTEDLAKMRFKKTLSMTQLKPVAIKTPAVLN